MTCEKMLCAKAFQKAVIRSFSAKGGVLGESVNDKDFCQYLMSMTDDFNNSVLKNAALILGRQPDSDTYVLGDKLQVPITYIICCFVFPITKH